MTIQNETNRKKGHYGCTKDGWDTCLVCSKAQQKICTFYLTCKKWNTHCHPDLCEACIYFFSM